MNRLLPQNEHAVERAIRVFLGVGLVGMTATGALGAWGYVGVVPLLTGLVGSCPAYTLLGINTRGKPSAPMTS